MSVHHPLAYLTTLVVFACAVGALPIGWYGGGNQPLTTPIVPYLGQFSYIHSHPPINLNPYNPLLRYLYPPQPNSPTVVLPDIPIPITSSVSKNWVLAILKWPGWDTVITEEDTRKKWKKLISTMSNYTDINNPEWSKQLRNWIEKQQDIVDLFSKVSGFMVKSPRWEKNIKVWLNFRSIPADYVKSFKDWLKSLIDHSQNKNPSTFPPGQMPPYFPSFPSSPWQPPMGPWNMPKNPTPDFEVDPRNGGFLNPRRFDFGQRPTESMDMYPQPPQGSQSPPFYPPSCSGYDCMPMSRPDFPQFPQFPPFPNESPQFPFPPQFPSQFPPQFPPQFQPQNPPQNPMMDNPYFGNFGFDENPFYNNEGMGYELPNFNTLRKKDDETAIENQMPCQVETIPDLQAQSCPQPEDISIILDLRRSNVTFCKTVLTAPRQSLKNLIILASFENKCFNLTTKVRDSRWRGPRGDYIFSLNGLSETNYTYWISYKDNGEKDTELNTFKPENGDLIIIDYTDYTDWNTIVNEIDTPK